MQTTRSPYLRDRLLSLHESSYLSLMSIVQGVVLGFLAFRVTSSLASFGLIAWILVLTTFLLVILTWNEYVIGIASFDWAPTLIDSMIPFLLCGTQIWLAATISDDPRQWFLGFAAFSCIASLAFLNMYWRASQYRKNKCLLQALTKHRRLVLFMSIGSAAAGFFFWFMQTLIQGWFLPALSLLVVVLFMLRAFAYRRSLNRLANQVDVDGLGVEVQPLAIRVSCTDDTLHVVLADGREISVPLVWSPRLQKATPEQRKDWRLIDDGVGIHWEAVDEDISVESLLRLK